ncbi:MAG: hypothetical protein JZU70_00930 [Chlorobium sp.]|jgi:hypothetical protein|nr:hypothetical protein [Chlorobium sp.]
MPTISTLSKIWGYSGADTLALDIGAGYSKIEAVHEGSAYVLKGTLISGGAVVDLGGFSEAIPSQYNYTATMTIGTGESAHLLTVNNIEAYHFTSGGVALDVYPLPPIVTTISPADGASGVVVSRILCSPSLSQSRQALGLLKFTAARPTVLLLPTTCFLAR